MGNDINKTFSSALTTSARNKVLLIASLMLGIAAIIMILAFLSSFLFSIVDPFTTSVIIEIIITGIIIGTAWALHTKLSRYM